MTCSFHSSVEGSNYTHHNSDSKRPALRYQEINMLLYHPRVQGVTTQLYNHATWRTPPGRWRMTEEPEGCAVCHIKDKLNEESSVPQHLLLPVWMWKISQSCCSLEFIVFEPNPRFSMSVSLILLNHQCAFKVQLCHDVQQPTVTFNQP